MHPCLENLEKVIIDHSHLTCRRLPQYDDDALRITDSFLSDREGVVTAQMITFNEIQLSIRISDPIDGDNDKVRNVYDFLFKLASSMKIAIFPDSKNQFSINVRFHCKRDLTELEHAMEANLEILRHFISTHGEEVHKFMAESGFLP